MDTWDLLSRGAQGGLTKIIVFINKPLRSYSGQLHTHTQASGHAIAQCDLEQNQSENKKTRKWQRWSFGRRLGWGKSKRGNRDVCDENVSNTCMRLTNDKLKKKCKQSNTPNKEKAWLNFSDSIFFICFLHPASSSIGVFVPTTWHRKKAWDDQFRLRPLCNQILLIRKQHPSTEHYPPLPPWCYFTSEDRRHLGCWGTAPAVQNHVGRVFIARMLVSRHQQSPH